MKSNFRFLLCCFCLLVTILAGCKVKRPNDVISESKMENLLYDYHLAKAMGENLPYDENYKKVLYLEAVFKKHSTTETIFDSSMVWYARNTEILSKIYERLNKRLKAQQNEINHLVALRDKKPKTSQPGDSIDVWAWQRLIRLTAMSMEDRFLFVMPSDSNFKERDTLIWEARYRFLEPVPDSTLMAVMAMQVAYANDSVIHRTVRITKSGTHQIRLFADTLGAIKEIRGFIYFKKERKESGSLFADRLSLMRYHCSDSLSFVARDSINKVHRLREDSLKGVAPDANLDSVRPALPADLQERLTPEEMNRRRREGTLKEKRPEQIEVEKHIQQERIEQRRERQLNNQRRSRPAR